MEKLRYGMAGGSLESFIGDIHRRAAATDGLIRLTAGCFSRDYQSSLMTASACGVDADRVYRTYEEMAEAEASRKDGIDFVTIATPNISHFEIARTFLERDIHVVCDKPVTMTAPQAEELKRLSEERGLLFAVTYGYTGYPVIRQAREMIETGKIGRILHVRVSHPEDWVIESVSEEKPEVLPWRFRPEIAGASLCAGDLGTHAEQLLVQFTGLHVKRVLALFDRYPAWSSLETNIEVLLDLGGGITGQLWASQLAAGKSCSPQIYVIGTKGSLEWNHEQPDLLKYTPVGEPARLLESGKNYMCESNRRISRVSAGHHEGFTEAFGNIYRAFAEALSARKMGAAGNTAAFPTIDDGLAGMKFIEACVRSQRDGNIWTEV